MALKKQILIIGCGLMLLSAACCPCKNLASSSTKIVRDSVAIKTEIKWRDSTIYTPSSLIDLLGLIPAPVDGKINLPTISKTSKSATLSLGIKDNKYYALCKCDSLEVTLKLYEKQITIYRQHIENLSAVRVVEVKYIPKWVKAFAWMGGLWLLFLIILIIIKIYKIFA